MYNAENYISNCLNSLLHQDLNEDDYEIIIIDDSSTDRSVDIVESYVSQHKNIKLLKQPNSGAFTTRNRLLKLAKGTYIFNLDADDYIVHNCLGELLLMAQARSLDIIGFDTVKTLDLNKTELSEPINSNELKVSSGFTFMENHPHLRHEIWWYFIKRDFLLNHHMEFSKNEYNADVMFTIEAFLKASKVGYIPVSIHRYVQSQDSIMRSKNIEVTKRRIEYMHDMISHKSQLINDLKHTSRSRSLIDNISHRRDVLAFFNIVSMIRNHFNLNFIKHKIETLKSVNAYPITNFNHYSYNKLYYGILIKILNNESLLYRLISFKNIFSKTIKN